MSYTSLIGYDALGRPTKVQEPPVNVERGGTAAVIERPRVAYWVQHRRRGTHQIGPENRTTSVSYDKAGRVISVTGAPYTPPGGTTVTPRTSWAMTPPAVSPR